MLMVRYYLCGRNGLRNAKVYRLPYRTNENTSASSTYIIAAGINMALVSKYGRDLAEIYHLVRSQNVFYEMPRSKSVDPFFTKG